MRKRFNGNSVKRMHDFLTAVYADIKSGKESLESITIGDYSRIYGVTTMAKSLIKDVIERDTAPSIDDAKSVRAKINQHAKIQRKLNEDNNELDEKYCIEFLKKRGYKVLKQKIEYVEI